MKDHRSEHYHWELRHWPEEDALEHYKKFLLSVDDMLAICAQRKRGYHNLNYDINIKTDEKSGKIYIEHDFVKCKDLLKNHLLLETLYARKDEVDWERVSCYYDYEVVERIGEILTSPLVWVPSEEAGEYGAVLGKIAREVDPVEGYDNDDRYDLYYDLKKNEIRWFVENLPEYSEKYHQERYGDHFPPGILLWDKFFQAQFGHFYYTDLREKLEAVADEFGSAKAAEILRLLKEDWPYIIKMKLFGINNLDNKYDLGTVTVIENALNGEFELYLKKWESQETDASAKPSKPTTPSKREPSSAVDRAIRAVYDSTLCKTPPDWAAVTRIFKELHLRQSNGLDYDAEYINSICGDEVTNDDSLKRSFIVDSVEGMFVDEDEHNRWRLKSGTENPKSIGLLKRYYEIGDIVVRHLREEKKA